ncbi:hypothetical protein [uncultured Roseobacter sp.]|uniref:hypothetical protein n=1 Tax=uncultured Roseobacter sp. TaxID=114847 RepID=UPI00261D08D5|nr:hypothetical protein [uncultured Roseobacter sp.]
MNSILRFLAGIFFTRTASATFVSTMLFFAQSTASLAQSESDSPEIEISSAIMTVLEVNASNCASYRHPTLKTFACQSEVGSYQAGRLAHAVEALAVSLLAAGVSSTSSDIQRSIYEDIAQFGVYRSISIPAMNLVDLSHSQSSPFGTESGMVSATSMIALEYLHPGVISATGSTLEGVANLADTSLTEGPQNFDEYMTAYAGRPTELGSLRMFGEFQDSAPILKRFVPPTNQISASGGNLLSDFFFEEPIAMDGKRSNPLGQLVSQAGMVAYNSGRPLTERHASESPEDFQMNFLGDTPFSGMACTLCAGSADETGDGVETEYISAPMFTEEFSVVSITAASPGDGNTAGGDPSELVSGIDLMSSASGAAENSANSSSTDSQLISPETKEKVACYASCGVAEVLTEGGDVAAESFKAAKDLLTGEGKDAWRENLNDVVEEVKDVTQIPNKCVETCENLDNPLDDDGNEPKNDDDGNTDLTDNGNNGGQGDDDTNDDNGTTTVGAGDSTGDAVASSNTESASAGDVASTSVPDDGGGCDPEMEGEGGCNCHADNQGMMLMPCTPDDGGAGPTMESSLDELNFGQTRWLFRQPTQPDQIGSVFSVTYNVDGPTGAITPNPVFTEIQSTGSGFQTGGGNPIPNPGGFQGRVSSPISIGGGISNPPNIFD